MIATHPARIARPAAPPQQMGSFEQFMAAQVAEMAASNLPPEVWIERHAEKFRATHPIQQMGD